jgi:hypothetical protein
MVRDLHEKNRFENILAPKERPVDLFGCLKNQVTDARINRSPGRCFYLAKIHFSNSAPLEA